MKKIILLLSLFLTLSLSGQILPGVIASQRVIAPPGDTLGTEKITNTTLTGTPPTPWGVTGGWSTNGSVATFDNVTNGMLFQLSANLISVIEANTTYRLEFDIVISSGGTDMWIGDTGLAVAYKTYTAYTNGHQVVRFTTSTSLGDGGINFFARNTATAFTIDNITLKEVL